MKLLFFFFSALLAGSTCAQALDSNSLSGVWVGSARFFNVKIQDQLGSMHVELRIHPDQTLSGTLGNAEIAAGKPVIRDQHIDYVATIKGQTHVGNGIKKEHVVLLITQLDRQKLIADFHLKNNVQWDWQMVVGVVDMTRQP